MQPVAASLSVVGSAVAAASLSVVGSAVAAASFSEVVSSAADSEVLCCISEPNNLHSFMGFQDRQVTSTV